VHFTELFFSHFAPNFSRLCKQSRPKPHRATAAPHKWNSPIGQRRWLGRGQGRIWLEVATYIHAARALRQGGLTVGRHGDIHRWSLGPRHITGGSRVTSPVKRRTGFSWSRNLGPRYNIRQGCQALCQLLARQRQPLQEDMIPPKLSLGTLMQHQSKANTAPPSKGINRESIHRPLKFKQAKSVSRSCNPSTKQ
jgi:hypothetical protein